MSHVFRAARGLALAALAFCAIAVQAQAPVAAKSFFGSQAFANGKPAGVASEARPVRFNSEEMLRLAPGESIQLALPNAISREVVFERSQAHGGGIYSWVGYFRERGKNNRVIVTSGPGGSYGVIDSPDGTYRIIPGDGHDWLVDMAQEQLHLPLPTLRNDERIPPPGKPGEIDAAQASFALAGAGEAMLPLTTPAPQAVIDMMVVVTQGMATKLGSNLMTRLYFLVTRANTTYTDSEIGMTLRLVKLTVVNYSDTDDDDVALNAISPGVVGGGQGVFANIETLRAAAGADIVSFMRDGSNFGGHGVAWVEGSSPNPLYMYSVITGCLASCESVFIHEVGHNMGNHHDRYTAAWQGPSAPSGSAYGYAFCRSGTLTCLPDIVTGSPGACGTTQPECSKSGVAIQDNSDFRDIMAYFQSSTQEVYRFSNPALNCATANGDGVQRPCGLAAPAGQATDTVTSMNGRRLDIQNIKSAVSAALMPGSLQFTQSAFSGSETGGTVTFTVSRVRDSTLVGGGGAVSVQYSVASGSATAGTDFTNASGTLNWADGDFANKTFSITVANDGVTEGNETFTATLANAAGAAGVFLGYPTTASGIITEPWPPGGALPSGWTTPTGVAWAVASDFSGDGDGTSLKSGVVTFPCPPTCSPVPPIPAASSTQYVGNFQAGSVSFFYKVNSYPNNGFFEFLVDGAVVLSDSGDSGTKSFTYALTAGSHTLQWRYRPTLYFACSGASPPPPQGSLNCLDRAWIDSVTLPPAAAPPSNPPRLANISTRGQVQTGFNVMIGGFVISGATAKTVVIRAIGPSLANFGVPGSLSNPTMQLVRISDNATLASNDDWGNTANVSLLQSAGLAPSSPLESALYITLQPGAYTVVVSGVGGATGVGLVEVYEIDQPDTPLINISTRGRVETLDNVMIGGFVIQGNGPETVLIRAIGPSLTNFGVAGALANPTMTLVRISDNVVLGTNDDWQTGGNVAAIQATGLAPTSPLESALLMTLQPGAYTAIVSGVAGGTGVGLVEVYKIGP